MGVRWILMIDVTISSCSMTAMGMSARNVPAPTGKLLIEFRLPAGDLPTRYGGEEFALLLPGATLAGARIVAERLRTRSKSCACPQGFADRK